jgi:hypothetical protein
MTMTPAQPPGMLVYTRTSRSAATLRGAMLVRSRTYEITLAGQVGRAVRAEFEDCTIIAGPDTTTLRAEVPDQAALWGLMQRIMGLGLEVAHVHLVASKSR